VDAGNGWSLAGKNWTIVPHSQAELRRVRRPDANVTMKTKTLSGFVQSGRPCASGLSLWILKALGAAVACAAVPTQESGPENLALAATFSGPGGTPASVADGVKGKEGEGEWAGDSPNAWYGWIDYPTLDVHWDTPRVINKVVLHDRCSETEHLAACVLRFSDGSEVHVTAVPNDGTAKTVVFEPRTVTSMAVVCTDGVGSHIGLSELEIYHDESAKLPIPAEKVYSDPVSYVDPTIETGRGRWFFCTPGSRPFGMVAAAAYTRNKNQGGGGYNYNTPEVRGFAQVHGWIMSGVNIMPTTGPVAPNLGEAGWKSSFSHDTEIIEPGYHRLYLDRYETRVEYTSTDRVAFYKLTYDEASEANLLLQLGGFVGAASYVDGRATLVRENRIEGSHGMTDRLWGGPLLSHVYFVMELDRPIERMNGWRGADETLLDIEEYHNPIPEGRIQTGYFRATEKYLFKNLPEEQAGVALSYRVHRNHDGLSGHQHDHRHLAEGPADQGRPREGLPGDEEQSLQGS